MHFMGTVKKQLLLQVLSWGLLGPAHCPEHPVGPSHVLSAPHPAASLHSPSPPVSNLLRLMFILSIYSKSTLF